MEGDLLELLKSKPNGEKLFLEAEKIKENAAEILAKINETFPEYTPHDIEHKKRVLKKMSLLIPDSLAEKINSYEVFFLVAATYLHDIGMANIPELKIPQELIEQEKIAEYIRDNHHERAGTIYRRTF